MMPDPIFWARDLIELSTPSPMGSRAASSPTRCHTKTLLCPLYGMGGPMWLQ